MRRKEQESKPLALRHQQVAEAIRTQHSRLVDNNITQIKCKEQTGKAEKEGEDIRKKIKELEEDRKQIEEAMEEDTTAEYIE
eukprot:8828137-Prorocentrum_lima.AAC.1